MATTISGNLGELTRTGPDRIPMFDWALGAAARLVNVRRTMSSQQAIHTRARIITSEGQIGQAYNEDAFRYFLSIEQKRVERTGHSFLLLLVKARSNGQPEEPFSSLVASRVFDALSLTLRDTDFTGWYRQGYVAGAVLTQLETKEHDVNRVIVERVTRAIADRLPPSLGDQLEVRLVESIPFEQS